jgi:hypothetical protein
VVVNDPCSATSAVSRGTNHETSDGEQAPGGDCKHCEMDGADVTYDLIITTRYRMAIDRIEL